MKTQDAELLAHAMTECCFSEKGCDRLPVRMIGEMPTDKSTDADVEMILLCVDHAAIYQPRGKVIFDEMLVSDENLKMFTDIKA